MKIESTAIHRALSAKRREQFKTGDVAGAVETARNETKIHQLKGDSIQEKSLDVSSSLVLRWEDWGDDAIYALGAASVGTVVLAGLSAWQIGSRFGFLPGVGAAVGGLAVGAGITAAYGLSSDAAVARKEQRVKALNQEKQHVESFQDIKPNRDIDSKHMLESLANQAKTLESQGHLSEADEARAAAKTLHKLKVGTLDEMMLKASKNKKAEVALTSAQKILPQKTWSPQGSLGNALDHTLASGQLETVNEFVSERENDLKTLTEQLERARSGSLAASDQTKPLFQERVGQLSNLVSQYEAELAFAEKNRQVISELTTLAQIDGATSQVVAKASNSDDLEKAKSKLHNELARTQANIEVNQLSRQIANG